MEWKWIENKNGRYRAFKASCSYCQKEIWKRKDQVLQDKVFCNNRCASNNRVTSPLLKCATCSTSVMRTLSQIARSKSGRVFCSRSCATIINNRDYKSLENHPNWKGTSYRKIALRHYGAKCQSASCPITFKIEEKMLDVHHIDGDRRNNSIENLIVLCVWCHAVETRKLW